MDVRCPHCRTPIQWQDNPYRPFCSERCRLLDLESWMSERYRVPLEPEHGASPDTNRHGSNGNPPSSE